MKFKSKISVTVTTILLLCSCKKQLEENTYAKLSPATYYNNETEALSTAALIYSAMGNMANVAAPWTISEIGTDEFVVPGRASGGWYDQNNIDIMLRQTTSSNTQIKNSWNNIFNAIGSANGLIDNLNKSSAAANLKGVIAEVKGLRAYLYFYALDFWGNVPVSTAPALDPSNLPATTSRADVFKFVEAEMLAAANDLPSVSSFGTAADRAKYYPRMTKEAAYMVLATMYLNAEVYTGTQRWSDASAMCDKIINTNAYALESSVVNNFKATTKGASKEVIFAISMDPAKNAGGNPFIIYAQPNLDQLRYNLPFAPANGFSTFQEALNRYENQDNRKNLIENGPQFYTNGNPLVDSKGVQLNLVNVVSYVSAADNEGYRVLKYVPDGASFSGISANNDLVLSRYSDVLLTKAEAQFRLANSGVALTLINQVRTRSNATALTALTLKNIEDERGREFIWEGHRRRDMIRFGDYFTGTWTFKTTNDPLTKGLYPVPADQLATNPNLKQNPGY